MKEVFKDSEEPEEENDSGMENVGFIFFSKYHPHTREVYEGMKLVSNQRYLYLMLVIVLRSS